MAMSFDDALRAIQDSTHKEIEIDTPLSEDNIFSLVVACIEAYASGMPLHIKYSLSDEAKENEAINDHLQNVLLVNRLRQDSVEVLKRYGDNKNKLNNPIYLDKDHSYENALHFYFKNLFEKKLPVNDKQYDVVNYLLDNQVINTKTTKIWLNALMHEGLLTTYRLSLKKENGYQNIGDIVKKEQVRILGNSLGLAGKISSQDESGLLQQYELEACSSSLAVTHLLDALEQFVNQDIFSEEGQFSQFKEQMKEVITIVKNGWNLAPHSDKALENLKLIVDQAMEGKTIYLPDCGPIEHCVPVVLSHKGFVTCNKNYVMRERKAAIYYEMPKDREELKRILNEIFSDKNTIEKIDNYLKCIEDHLTEIKSILGSPQKVDSCTVTNNRMAFRVIIDLCIDDEEIAKAIYKAFSAFQRTYELKRFLASPIAQEDPLFVFDILQLLLLNQHNQDKPDELYRMLNVIAQELSKDKYKEYVEKFCESLVKYEKDPNYYFDSMGPERTKAYKNSGGQPDFAGILELLGWGMELRSVKLEKSTHPLTSPHASTLFMHKSETNSVEQPQQQNESHHFKRAMKKIFGLKKFHRHTSVHSETLFIYNSETIGVVDPSQQQNQSSHFKQIMKKIFR